MMVINNCYFSVILRMQVFDEKTIAGIRTGAFFDWFSIEFRLIFD